MGVGVGVGVGFSAGAMQWREQQQQRARHQVALRLQLEEQQRRERERVRALELRGTDPLVPPSLSSLSSLAEAKDGGSFTRSSDSAKLDDKGRSQSSSSSSSSFSSSAKASKDTAQADEPLSGLCCCCWELPKTVVLLPCRHLCVCEACGLDEAALATCPMCRQRIAQRFKVFT